MITSKNCTWFLLLIACLITFKAKAQYSYIEGDKNTCIQILKKAQTTYDQGRINEVAPMLENCLKEGFSKDEKIAAYKLLTLVYIYFNEREKAEQNMLQFLRLNPEYKINPSIDPSEFINLYNTFRTHPIFLIGIKGGVNLPNVHVLQNFSVDKADIPRGNYTPFIGYQAGISMEIPFSKKWSLNPEVYFTNKKYQYNDLILNFANLSFTETQSWLELPLLAKYTFGKNKILPFLNAGVTLQYLLNTSATALRRDVVSEEIQREVNLKFFSLDQQRHSFNLAGTIGVGVKLKNIIGKGSIIVDVRYNYGLLNMVNSKNRYTNTDLIYDYGYIDNNFTLNTFNFTVGYIIPKYNPKVLKKKQKQGE